MGRVESCTKKIGIYKFVLEIDFGGDPDNLYSAWVVDKQRNNTIACKSFKTKDFHMNHFNNFCNKFANNEEYRKTQINR